MQRVLRSEVARRLALPYDLNTRIIREGFRADTASLISFQPVLLSSLLVFPRSKCHSFGSMLGAPIHPSHSQVLGGDYHNQLFKRVDPR